MRPFRRPYRLLLLLCLLGCLSIPLSAQDGRAFGRSIQWRPVQAPFTPQSADGAIAGGPGSDPNPGTPMYVCRAQVQGSLVPGKWVQGNCNVAFGGSEQITRSYEVAYGSANWGPYRGNTYGLAQTGNEPDGSPLYSCRVHYSAGLMNTDYGFQPGKLVSDGTCHIPMGGVEVSQAPPFEVLYATGGGRPPYPYPPSYPPQQPLPGCKLSDPGVTLDTNSGHWVGPDCSPSDGLGHTAEPKYPYGPPAYPQPVLPPPPYEPGASSVTWQPAQSPFVPGQGAIMGGPGNGPKPGAPLYVCRASYNNALYPGKWLEGKCSFADDAGKEQTATTYEVANGPAEWQNFDGNVGALVPGGFDADGTHLFICRKQISLFGSNKGFQPGRLENGVCHISYNVDMTSNPPFEALYNVFGAPAAAGQPATASPPPAAPGQPHGILVSFLDGTSTASGMVTVTNGSTGTMVSKPLPPNSTAQQCMGVVQQAALQAGLQIQSLPDGSGLRLFGAGNVVNITEASISVRQF